MTRVLEYLEILAGETDHPVYRCLRCRHVLGGAEVSFKKHAASYDSPVSEGQPERGAGVMHEGWILRHFICPGCGVLLEVEMLPAGEQSVDSVILGSVRMGGSSINQRSET